MSAVQWLFVLYALGTCGGAVAVVVTQNVVRMAFWLVESLGSVAGLFFLLNADFVAATQLLIYVGGTVVLLIFGVMLTATGPYLKIETSPAEGVMAAGIGSLFLAMIVSTVARSWTVPDEARSAIHAMVAGTKMDDAFKVTETNKDGKLAKTDVPEKVPQAPDADLQVGRRMPDAGRIGRPTKVTSAKDEGNTAAIGTGVAGSAAG